MNEIDEKALYEHVDESFRDSVSTIDQKGKRVWIYPKKQTGFFYKWRTYVSFLLLGLLFGLPFIKVNGEPLLLFNILERKFIIFGLTFFPQDFHLFGLTMLTLMLFIVLFTVAFGRLFCGWACPQTIFMEMIFRKIEYWIEGDANEQKKLNALPWNGEKIRKKAAKLSIFYAISFLIGNTFLAYIIGIDKLTDIITSPPSEHLAGFMGMLIFSGVFFFVFTYLREQVCLVVCPYGRLQGVLLDKDSIVVAYDFVRGEPRGKIKKQTAPQKTTAPAETAIAIANDGNVAIAEPQLGDCIDCGLCVRVCPTGIDIRNGTQLECINCTACIDACDSIMEKVNRPTGLIRYASYNGIVNKVKFHVTPRIAAYSGVLTLMVVLVGYLLLSRGDVEATLLRTAGSLFQEVNETTISNMYNLQLVNKTVNELPVEVKIVEPDGAKLRAVGINQGSASDANAGATAAAVFNLPKQSTNDHVLFIDLPKANLSKRNTPVVVEVYANNKKVDRIKTNFIGPFVIK
ncbi:MAG TPA: cytochrome c oxidase accessory protein CcoG [Chitinophagales bacterium]|nr:cytochrome c oxidase accessory protein CcoG [Chitinophagales bacterium]HRK26260.1 cytochrome c oxidase accessory protein CcoG [Chitinophagales bacterium]